MAERLVITDPKYQSLAGEIRALKLRDYSADLGLTPCTSLQGPADTPLLRLVPDRFQDARDQTAAWRVALDYFYGRKIDFQSCFGTVPDWLVIGPFPSNAEFSGHETSFPPEHSLDLHADYDGVKGKVRWRKHAQKGSNASIDFKKIFEPGERVSAYALCFVTSSQEQDVQLRFASNDAGKVWIGGKKVHDYPHEGTVFLDRDIIPVRLPKGTSPILVKITNNLVNWGFVLRLTDDRGRALRNVSFSLAPEN
jgi:hypothetical protein